MFFILSQLFSFLAMPFTICLLLIASGIFIKNRKLAKKSLVLGFILLLFFSNKYISNLVMNYWEPDYVDMESLPTYDLGIVLTGVTNLDKSSGNRTFFNKGADRATHAMQLYKMGKIKKILITGGQGFSPTHDRSEAEVLKAFLVWAGVPGMDILVETKAQNTRENALFTKAMLQEKGLEELSGLLIITSAFHMQRSKACFEKVGLNVSPFPVDYYGSDQGLNLKSALQPSVDAIVHWHKLTKEWIGILVYRMVGYL